MTVHVRNGIRIRTDFVYAPISVRRFDWAAIDDDRYDGAPDSDNRGEVGYGETEEAAIVDLLELVEMRQCPIG